MIGYVSVEEQVDKDFHSARRKAFLRHWRNRLRKDSTHDRLLPFDEAKNTLERWGQAYRGIRPVEVEKIRGSVGRYRDFDGTFLPLKESMLDRWSHIDRAYHRGKELPPVSLYKIDGAYFVRDGNHRVSVARYHGVTAIDAEVVELRGRAKDAAQHTPRTANNPAHRLQDPPEPNVSLLHYLRQRIRPDSLGPGARRVTWQW
jgi:hypothetical protein